MALIDEPTVGLRLPSDSTAPYFDNLCLWYPATSPFMEYYSCALADRYVVNGGSQYLHGEDNSLRRIYTPRAHGVNCEIIPTNYGDFTWALMLKVYSWVNTGDTYYYNQPDLIATTCYAGYLMILSYWCDDAYGNPRHLSFTRLHADAPYGGVAGPIPTGEWVHIAMTYQYWAGLATFYINGKPVGTTVDARSAYPPQGSTVFLSGNSLGVRSGADNTTKDYRIYNLAFNDTQVQWLYEDSFTLHHATSTWIQSAVPIPGIVIPPVTGHSDQHHHIIGAV